MSERPEPLVSAEVDIRDFQFMPLDVARLRDSDLAANETPEACWAAVLIWAASWHQVPAASIPNDDRWLAKTAGYAQRGRIAKEWAGIKTGALRNWVECSDGRLYHPVVAEKAMDAWRSKIQRRWNAECARIKKANQRHGTTTAAPTFEQWSAGRCPKGQSEPVPRDTDDSPQNVSRDQASKGQGEGQGQGQSSFDGRDRDGLQELHRRLIEAAGGHVAQGVGTEVVTPILHLIDQGCDVERHILPAVRQVVPRLAKPLGSWGAKFVTEAVLALRDQDRDRVQPAPDVPRIDFGAGIAWPESSVRKAVQCWRQDPRSWPDLLGEPPDRPGCKVPPRLLTEIAA